MVAGFSLLKVDNYNLYSSATSYNYTYLIRIEENDLFMTSI